MRFYPLLMPLPHALPLPLLGDEQQNYCELSMANASYATDAHSRPDPGSLI